MSPGPPLLASQLPASARDHRRVPGLDEVTPLVLLSLLLPEVVQTVGLFEGVHQSPATGYGGLYHGLGELLSSHLGVPADHTLQYLQYCSTIFCSVLT